MQFSRRLTLKGIADGSLPLTFVLVTICLYTPYFVDFITDHRVVASVPAFLSLPILDSTTALFAFRSYPPDPMTAGASRGGVLHSVRLQGWQTQAHRMLMHSHFISAFDDRLESIRSG